MTKNLRRGISIFIATMITLRIMMPLLAPWQGNFNQWLGVFIGGIWAAVALWWLYILWRGGPSAVRQAWQERTARNARPLSAPGKNILLLAIIGVLLFVIFSFVQSK
jgi:hypothetical protein